MSSVASLGVALLRDDPIGAVAGEGEGRKPIPMLMFNLAPAPKARAGHLGLPELEAVVRADGDEVWRAGDGILDRLDRGRQKVPYHKSAPSALEIEFKLDLREQRLQLVLDSRGVDREAGRRLLLLSAEDREQGVDLPRPR